MDFLILLFKNYGIEKRIPPVAGHCCVGGALSLVPLTQLPCSTGPTFLAGKAIRL